MLLPRRTAARFLVAILLLSTFSPASAFADTAFSLHAVRYNLTYVAGQLASFFSDLAEAIASHIPVTSLTASAAAPPPSQIPPPAPAPDFLATTTPEASTPPITTTASDAPQTTIIQQPVIERIVERTVPAPAASGISEQTLAGRLASLKDDLLLRIAAVASAPIAFSGPAPATPVSTATFASSQRIDQLTNTAINTPTITGGTISGASVSGYLPLSGGTLSGTLSAGTLALSGGLTGTDASFSGPLSAGTLNLTNALSVGNGGTGTTTAIGITNTAQFLAIGAGAVSRSVSGKLADILNVKDFGAVGDGIADDTASIVAADSAARSAGKALWFPAGTYRSGSITIATSTNWVCDGNTHTVIKAKNSLNADFITTGTETRADDISIRGCVFDGNRANNTTGDTLKISGSRPSLQDISIINSPGNGLITSWDNTTGGRTFGSAGYFRNITIDTTSKTGWLCNGPSDNHFDAITIIDAGISADNSWYGMYAQGSCNGRWTNFHHSNRDVTTNTPIAGLYLSTSANNFVGSHFEGGHAGLIVNSTINTISSSECYAPRGPYACQILGGYNTIDMVVGGNAASANLNYIGVYLNSGNNNLNIVDADTGTGASSGTISFGAGDANNTVRLSGIRTNGAVVTGTPAATDNIQFLVSGSQATSTGAWASTQRFKAGASTTAFSISGTGYFPDGGTWTLDGKVGIGTLAPAAYLHIVSASTTEAKNLVLQNTSTGGQSIELQTSVGATGGKLLWDNNNGNTWLFSGTSANLLFGSGGQNERMRITSAGNVGIGTTTPWGKLSVTGSGTGTGLAFAVADSANTPRFVIQDNGNVGIGTTTPDAKMHIVGQAHIGDADAASFLLNLGSVGAGGYRSGYLYGNGTNILLLNQQAGALQFGTNNTEYMRINSSGNVGIGTTTPAVKLHVAGDSIGSVSINTPSMDASAYTPSGVGAFAIRQGSAATDNSLIFGISSSAGNSWIQSVDAGSQYLPLSLNPSGGNVGIGTTTPSRLLTLASAGSPEFALMSSDSGSRLWTLQCTSGAGPLPGAFQIIDRTANTASLLIDTSGNVGIGTTSPQSKLHIATGFSGVTPFAGTNLTIEGTTGGYLSLLGNGTFDNGILFGNPTSNADGAILYDSAATPRGLQFRTGGNQTRLTINSSGNVGIGTTTPTVPLVVSKGSAGATTPNSNSIAAFTNSSTGYLSILTPDASERGILFGEPSNAAAGSIIYNTASVLDGLDFRVNGNSTKMVIDSSGNVGIGTTTPDMLLSVGSSVPVGSVAHFENSTGSCYINPTTTSLSCSSDARLKANVTPLASSTLEALLKLEPVTYNWRTESATSSAHTGFIAQEVQQIFPDLISQGPDGYYTLNYAGLTPYLTKAVQEMVAISGAFKANLIAWLGDSANGIDKIFAKDIYATNGTFDSLTAHHVHSDELCAGSVCVNQQQLAALLAALGQQATAGAPLLTGLSIATTAPPVIQINGKNPAYIHIGDAYADLGATIVAPDSDKNLGIVIVLDGATTSAISIDTTAPGEHTILYTVTSPTSGLTGSIMRTVTVSPVEQSLEPQANDNPFNAPATSNPANDNTSSTSLLITEPAVVSL